MSYLGPSPPPRPPGTAPPQRADPCGPMAGRAWPGAGGPGRPVRGGPDASQYRKATSQHPQATDQHSQANTPVLAGNTPVLAGNTPALGNGQYSRQPGSTRGNWACFVRFGAWVRYLHFLACAQAGLGLTAVARQPTGPSRRLRLKSLPILGGPDGGSGRTQDAGIPPARTPEGGRQGWGEGVICRKPPCTIAIRPWRQTGSRHHSGPITAARGA